MAALLGSPYWLWLCLHPANELVSWHVFLMQKKKFSFLLYIFLIEIKFYRKETNFVQKKWLTWLESRCRHFTVQYSKSKSFLVQWFPFCNFLNCFKKKKRRKDDTKPPNCSESVQTGKGVWTKASNERNVDAANKTLWLMGCSKFRDGVMWFCFLF